MTRKKTRMQTYRGGGSQSNILTVHKTNMYDALGTS